MTAASPSGPEARREPQGEPRIGWLDCGSGVSGDMLLGALVSVGVPLDVLSAAVDAVAPERLVLRAERVRRNGLAATHVHIDGTESHVHRRWADVRDLLAAADLAPEVRDRALETFRRLAVAEARVHDTTPDEVHFHEVGALDAIADVVGVCAGFVHLGLDRLTCSPVAVGSGFVRAAHGRLPVPVPAVVELLGDTQGDGAVPSYAGELEPGTPVGELCTPTGAALLRTFVSAWGAQPSMVVEAQGMGAGTRDPEGRANVVRLLVGRAAGSTAAQSTAARSTTARSTAARRPTTERSTQVVVETNVDDLDPRLWPGVLQRLLDAGAADAWLTPVLMKKGRPAHTLSVLADPELLEPVRRIVVTETSAIGVRVSEVDKYPLAREVRTVTVDGEPVRVKLAFHGGEVVNAQPEFDDVLAAARRLGRPAKTVLAQAQALARSCSE